MPTAELNDQTPDADTVMKGSNGGKWERKILASPPAPLPDSLTLLIRVDPQEAFSPPSSRPKPMKRTTRAESKSGAVKEILELVMPIGEKMDIEKAKRDEALPPPGYALPGYPYYCDAAVLSIQDLFNRQFEKRYRTVNIENLACGRCKIKGHTPGFCLRASCFNCNEMGHRSDECRFNERVCTHCKSTEHLQSECPRAPLGQREQVPWGFHKERKKITEAYRRGVNITEEMYSRYPIYTGAVDYTQLTSGGDFNAAGPEEQQAEPEVAMALEEQEDDKCPVGIIIDFDC